MTTVTETTDWPDEDNLKTKNRGWKNCMCGKALYVVHRNSQNFKLPADFRSFWPFDGSAGWVIHGTREDTEACQVSVVHYPEFPFICHHYTEVMEGEERTKVVQELFSRVRMSALSPHLHGSHPGAACRVCNQPWYLVFDPKTGRAVTVHNGMEAERRCAMLARITRGAKP